MRQIQNRYDQACNGYDYHKLFVCTHMHPLLSRLRIGKCSRPTGCRDKYIICAGAIAGCGAGQDKPERALPTASAGVIISVTPFLTLPALGFVMMTNVIFFICEEWIRYSSGSVSCSVCCIKLKSIAKINIDIIRISLRVKIFSKSWIFCF